ncbi:hypothetical protein R1flu_022487 [Riccia fluitans]|uniref:Uncharacterized protein n=1 Tax=Riccia fluitans TaxID=41844 RepID=A0ABD1XPW9_9MARC
MKTRKIFKRLISGEYVFSPWSVCYALIQDAVHRCKDSKVATRITVTTTDTMDGAYRVSVADTGYGMRESMLEDFFPHHIRGGTGEFPRGDLHWDGGLLITTTCLDEAFIRDYKIKMGHKATNRKTIQTHIQPKRNAFRGTECSIIVKGNVTPLQLFILDICKKITFLSLKNVFVEVCAKFYDDRGLQETRSLAIYDGVDTLAENASDLDRLHAGFEDYTLKNIHNFREALTQEGLPR